MFQTVRVGQRVLKGTERLGHGRKLGSDGIYPYINLLNNCQLYLRHWARYWGDQE